MKSKMEWKKPSKKMIDLLDSILPKNPEVERKRMFEYSVGFTNGNMFMGLHSDGIILKIWRRRTGKFYQKI